VNRFSQNKNKNKNKNKDKDKDKDKPSPKEELLLSPLTKAVSAKKEERK
jgi:hypothetical protein